MARRDQGGQQPYPQQGYPQQGYPPPAPPKKRKKWPFIVGGIVLLFIIIGVSTGGGSDDPADTAAPAPAAPAAGQPAPVEQAEQPAAPEGITYEVTGEGDGGGSGSGIESSVTYTSDDNFNQSQENGIDLPWTKTVDLGNGFLTAASLVAQAGDGIESITCRIRDGDEVISENTSTGQFAVVTCSGT